MNPWVKRVAAGLAVKEAVEKIQEWREPKKPSFFARAGKTTLFLAAGGGIYYLYKSGRLTPLIDQFRGKSGRDAYTYSPGDETIERSSAVDKPTV